jgi:hypothetical protein
LEDLEARDTRIDVSLSELEKTLSDFQGLLRQNTEGMDMVMETAQALSETLNSMIPGVP